MSWNPVPINHSVADLMMEVEEQFGQVMNSFMEAGRMGDPLRYDRAVTRVISGFNKARDRCYMAFRSIDKNKVKRMEEMVKQETSRFCTNALMKVKERKKEKEKKHKEMMEEEEVMKHRRTKEKEVSSKYKRKFWKLTPQQELDPHFVFTVCSEDEEEAEEEYFIEERSEAKQKERKMLNNLKRMKK